MSSEFQSRFTGDAHLYSGFLEGIVYISVVRFDLSQLPTDVSPVEATLRLTGLQDAELDRSAEVNWSVQLIAEDDLPALAEAGFVEVFTAPASITLSPSLQPANVAPGTVNEWQFDEEAVTWLHQQRLDGATAVMIRISPFPVIDGTLFAWDSGYGSESNGAIPELLLELEPARPTTP
jgi:hypothetical protein